MKTSDELKELTQLNADELRERIIECRREQLHMRMRRAVSGQVETPHRYRELRRTIARAKTMLRAQQLQQSQQPQQPQQQAPANESGESA